MRAKVRVMVLGTYESVPPFVVGQYDPVSACMAIDRAVDELKLNAKQAGHLAQFMADGAQRAMQECLETNWPEALEEKPKVDA